MTYSSFLGFFIITLIVVYLYTTTFRISSSPFWVDCTQIRLFWPVDTYLFFVGQSLKLKGKHYSSIFCYFTKGVSKFTLFFLIVVSKDIIYIQNNCMFPWSLWNNLYVTDGYVLNVYTKKIFIYVLKRLILYSYGCVCVSSCPFITLYLSTPDSDILYLELLIFNSFVILQSWTFIRIKFHCH